MSQERVERDRRIRRKLHEAIQEVVAAVDNGEYVGVYVHPEDVPEAEKRVQDGDWEGVPVYVRQAPPISR